MTKNASIQLFGEIGQAVTSRDFHAMLADLRDVKTVFLDIHSEGGAIGDGFHIYHQILSHPARFIVNVPSIAASMAAVVAMAGDEIRMAENAFLVLHNPYFAEISGEARVLRHAADLLDAFKVNATRAFRRHSSLGDDEISALMDAETWLTAHEALGKGFAQQVTDRIEAVNRVDLSRFRRIPPAARCLIAQPQGEPVMSDKPDKPVTKEEPAKETPPVEPAATAPVQPADESPETLWTRLGQMLLGKGPKEPARTAGTLSAEETAAVLAIERQALRKDRARFALDRDLGPHRDAIEPAQLEKLEPILLKLKTAELDGDQDAATQYANLAALLPSLASQKAGGPLAGSDDGAPVASLEISAERRRVEERHGIDDKRREALMRKYPGCRPGAVQVLS